MTRQDTHVHNQPNELMTTQHMRSTWPDHMIQTRETHGNRGIKHDNHYLQNKRHKSINMKQNPTSSVT